MASYRGHLVGGFAAGAVYTGVMLFVPIERFAEYAHLLRDWQPIAAVFIFAMLFGLFPDVDTKSKGQGIFYWAAFLLDVLLIINHQLQAAAYLGIVAMLPLLTKHRGWTHAIWSAFLIPVPIIVVPYLYDEKLLSISLVFYGAAVSGYLSHLLFDGLLIKWFRVSW